MLDPNLMPLPPSVLLDFELGLLLPSTQLLFIWVTELPEGRSYCDARRASFGVNLFGGHTHLLFLLGLWRESAVVSKICTALGIQVQDCRVDERPVAEAVGVL